MRGSANVALAVFALLLAHGGFVACASREQGREVVALPPAAEGDVAPLAVAAPPLGAPDEAIVKTPAGWRTALTERSPVVAVHTMRHTARLAMGEGDLTLDLVPELLVSLRRADSGGPTGGGVREPPPPPFVVVERNQPDGGSWSLVATSTMPAADYVLRVRNDAGDPRIRVSLEVAYKADVYVAQEAVRFTVRHARRAHVLDRAYRVVEARGQRLFSGPLTPHLAFFGGVAQSLSFLGGQGVQGLWVEPSGEGDYAATVELDERGNHPLDVHVDCVEDAGQRVASDVVDESLRRRGERQVMDFDWVVGNATPLRTARFPRGYRSAVVLTDHADQSDRQKLEAFAFGASGAVARGEIGPGWPGFVNRGLAYTKTIFLETTKGYDPQFDDARYRAVLDEMQRAGVEIGLHSPSGWRDSPREAPALFAEFRRRYSGTTWIDHQPHTNCEAITNRGWDRRQPDWYMLDALADSGVRYLWARKDYPLATGSLNLLAPEKPGERRPIVFRNNQIRPSSGEPFVLFASAWLFMNRDRVLDKFSPQALESLVSERGILIGHTYLDSYRLKGRHVGKRLMESDVTGRLRLRPDVDELFTTLAGRQRDREIWVTSMEQLAGHLESLELIAIDYEPGGRALVRALDGRPHPGLTLLLPADMGADFHVGGAPCAANCEAQGTYSAVWLDVPAEGGVLVEAPRGVDGKPRDFLSPAHVRLIVDGD